MIATNKLKFFLGNYSVYGFEIQLSRNSAQLRTHYSKLNSYSQPNLPIYFSNMPVLIISLRLLLLESEGKNAQRPIRVVRYIQILLTHG